MLQNYSKVTEKRKKNWYLQTYSRFHRTNMLLLHEQGHFDYTHITRHRVYTYYVRLTKLIKKLTQSFKY